MFDTSFMKGQCTLGVPRRRTFALSRFVIVFLVCLTLFASRAVRAEEAALTLTVISEAQATHSVKSGSYLTAESNKKMTTFFLKEGTKYRVTLGGLVGDNATQLYNTATWKLNSPVGTTAKTVIIGKLDPANADLRPADEVGRFQDELQTQKGRGLIDIKAIARGEVTLTVTLTDDRQQTFLFAVAKEPQSLKVTLNEQAVNEDAVLNLRQDTVTKFKADLGDSGYVKWTIPTANGLRFEGDTSGDETTRIVNIAAPVSLVGTMSRPSPVEITAESLLPDMAGKTLIRKFKVMVSPSVGEIQVIGLPDAGQFLTARPNQNDLLRVPVKKSFTLKAHSNGAPLSVNWKKSDPASILSKPMPETPNGVPEVKYTAQSVGRASINAEYIQVGTTIPSKTIEVEVYPLTEKVKFVGNTRLTKNGSTKLSLKFSDNNGNIVEKQDVPLFDLDVSDKSVIDATIENQDDLTEITLHALKSGTATLTISIPENDPTDPTKMTKGVIGKVRIVVSEILRFERVEVGLQQMPPQDVSDAFGGRIDGEYYCFKITITNRNQFTANLKDEKRRSILVSNGSVGVKVFLEKRYDARRNSIRPDQRSSVTAAEQTDGNNSKLPPKPSDKNSIKQWSIMTVADYARRPVSIKGTEFTIGELADRDKISSDKAEAQYRSSNLISAPTLVILPSETRIYANESLPLRALNGAKIEEDILWTSSDETFAVIENGVFKALRKGVVMIVGRLRSAPETWGKALITVEENLNPFAMTFHPYHQQLVLNINDVRNAQTARFEPISLLSLGGTIGSFLIGSNMFTDNDNVLGNLTGILIPALRSQFPNLKDKQRDNLERWLMKPAEQIAYGETIERLLLFPKRAFPGAISGYETRIGSIRTDYVTMQVAVIEDVDTEQGSPTRNGN